MNKMLKKITSVALAIAMVVTTVYVGNPTTAQAKVTIKSKKTVTLIAGNSSKIKVKQKGAKFTSSNKKIATVSKKGKIKAKKPGTCKITVKVKKSKKKVTVKVTPGATSIDYAKNTATNGISLEWTGVSGATGYQIYYSTNSKSGFKVTTVGKVTRTTVNGLTAGSTYYFKIKPIAKVRGKTYVCSKFSNVVSDKVRKMVWNDEFSGTTIDSTKWTTEGATGNGGPENPGFGNKERQNYQPEYSEVKDGNLIIKPQFEWNPRTKTVVNNSIYSTKLWTRGLYTLTYGKVEFRAKLPKGQGTWAACWMLGNDSNYGTWPKCGEIDVLETMSEASKTVIPQSIHNTKFNGMPTSSGNKYKHTTVATATSEYHTYGIIWNAKEVTFTIDGKVIWSYNPSRYMATGNAWANSSIWPFNKPFYLIINCAIGGTLGGNIGTNYWTKVGTKTYPDGGVNDVYQDKMYVDYVRVYQ